MKAYTLTWDSGYRNLMVGQCPSIEDAKAAVDGARADAGVAAAAPEDLDLSGPALVGLYNAIGILADLGIPSITRFTTRGDGQRRVFSMLESNFKNAPEVAAPSTVDTRAEATETINHEDDMADKGKKMKKVRIKKERVAKTPRAKTANGEGKPVRAGSSLGKLVTFMIDGNKTYDQMAKALDLRVDQVKHRIGQHLRVKNGIGAKVNSEGKVSIVYPTGFGKATIIKAAKE